MCEYIINRGYGIKPLHVLTQLPSDAIEITGIKGIRGRIRKDFLFYNPKIHEIYEKPKRPIDDSFPYTVVEDRTIWIGPGKEMLTSYLYASCEEKFKDL